MIEGPNKELIEKTSKEVANRISKLVRAQCLIKYFQIARENDINLEVTQVGDRNVLKSMIKNGYVIGGEQSGHIIFKDYANTGDGQLTAVQLIDCINNSSESVSDLAKLMIKFPQVLVNIKADKNQKKNIFKIEKLKTILKKKKKFWETIVAY